MTRPNSITIVDLIKSLQRALEDNLILTDDQVNGNAVGNLTIHRADAMIGYIELAGADAGKTQLWSDD